MKLYKEFSDEDGHKYLVPREKYSAMLQALDDLYDMLFNEDEDTYYDQFETTLDGYGAISFEGEEYFIDLDKDIVK